MSVTSQITSKSPLLTDLQVSVDGVLRLSAEVEQQPWDTEMLGRPVARLNGLKAHWQTQTELGSLVWPNVFSEMVAVLGRLSCKYVTIRCKHGEWFELHHLERAGFQLVDVVVEFAKDLPAASGKGGVPRPPSLKLPTGYGCRPLGDADVAAVSQLAVKNFSLSRFHNDPLLAKAQVDRLHAEWAKNCCLGKAAEKVWVLTAGIDIAGFVTNTVSGKTGMIDLIAISSGESGRGFGQALLSQAESWFAARGCTEVTVKTQANNYAAMALYTGGGYRIRLTQNTLRWATL